MDKTDQALLALGRELRSASYRFVTPTPETLRRVNARAENATARTVRDVFGWNRPFPAHVLPAEMFRLLQAADAVSQVGALWQSRVRFATLRDALFVHSAYPTTAKDAVFFGPDTYRFARLIQRALGARKPGLIRCAVDIGCGAGAGGLLLATLFRGQSEMRVVLADINRQALRFARINADLAAVKTVECVASDVLAEVPGPIDLIVSNPPYMVDSAARLYRDGGGELGFDLALRIVSEALPRLSRSGQFILYSGAPVVDGVDLFWHSVEPLLTAAKVRFDYSEIDPDVFSEELETPAYAHVDRIAAVGLVVHGM